MTPTQTALFPNPPTLAPAAAIITISPSTLPYPAPHTRLPNTNTLTCIMHSRNNTHWQRRVTLYPYGSTCAAALKVAQGLLCSPNATCPCLHWGSSGEVAPEGAPPPATVHGIRKSLLQLDAQGPPTQCRDTDSRHAGGPFVTSRLSAAADCNRVGCSRRLLSRAFCAMRRPTLRGTRAARQHIPDTGVVA